MELSALDVRAKANEGAFCHFTHPGTGEPLFDNGDQEKPVGIYLLGLDSDLFQKKKHEKANSFIFEKKKSPKVKTSEQIDRETIEALADMTTGWKNLSIDGNSTFSHDLAVELFSRYPWAREQANVFTADRNNFLV